MWLFLPAITFLRHRTHLLPNTLLRLHAVAISWDGVMRSALQSHNSRRVFVQNCCAAFGGSLLTRNVSLEDYHSLLCLVCIDFPLSVVVEAATASLHKTEGALPRLAMEFLVSRYPPLSDALVFFSSFFCVDAIYLWRMGCCKRGARCCRVVDSMAR